MDKTHDSVALEAFHELFSAYQYPFKSSDQLLEAQDTGARALYYERAKALTENEVLRQEITELKRGVYAQLALQSVTDVERTAYRSTLIAIVSFEKRLVALADRVKSLPFKRVVDEL